MFGFDDSKVAKLTAKAVKSASLSLQSVDNIEGSDCLATGVLCVCDCISNHVFQEHLYNKSAHVSRSLGALAQKDFKQYSMNYSSSWYTTPRESQEFQ